VAKLHFRYGAMNCGKSDTMISTAFNYTENELTVVTMMPEMSMRKDGYTTSRAGKEWPIDMATHKSGDELPDGTKYEDTTPIYETFHQQFGNRVVNCVLVDEVNFMSPEQVDDLERLAKVDGTSVIAYGIRTNIQRHLFDGTKRMFELADTTEKMPTMCPCGRQAEFNGRFVDGNFHVGEPIVWIDNDPDRVRYQSLCGQCYLDNMQSPGAITV
jgi:thymidine kinase